MKRIVATLIVATLSVPAFAEDFATAKDAEGMVGKAVKAIAANKDATLKEITAKDKKWVVKDLYPVVYTMDGKCLAHGANIKMVGRDLLDNKDVDGKPYMKERLDMMKSAATGWQKYKFLNPVTKQIEPKEMYLEKHGDLIFGCGVYS